jgi:hypothetical protein
LLRAGDFMPGFFSRLLWGCMISEFDRGPRGLCRRGGRPKLGSLNSGHLAKVQVVAEVRERDRVLCDKAATLGVLASLRLCRRPSYSDENSIRAVSKNWRAIGGTDYYVRLISLTAPLTSPATAAPQLTGLR